MPNNSESKGTEKPSTRSLAEAISSGDARNEFSTEERSQPTLSEALKTVHLSDLKEVHKKPCSRDALLVGIGSGFAFGGVKLFLRAPVPNAANWAVGVFCATSLIAYEACQYRRMKERDGMKRAVEIIDRRQKEHERKVQEARERKAQEEAEKAEKARLEAEAAQKKWYKPW